MNGKFQKKGSGLIGSYSSMQGDHRTRVVTIINNEVSLKKTLEMMCGRTKSPNTRE